MPQAGARKGVAVSPFILRQARDKIFNTLEQEVTYKTVTRTKSTMSGTDEESFTESTERVIILRQERARTWNVEGLFEEEVDVILTKPSLQPKNGDKVVAAFGDEMTVKHVQPGDEWAGEVLFYVAVSTRSGP